MKRIKSFTAESYKESAKISSARKSRASRDRIPTSEQEFADKYKTKLALDELGDPIIPGTNGHLYFGDGLCWLKLGPVKHLVKARNTFADVPGVRFWSGDDSSDLDVQNIPPELWERTMDLAGVKFKRSRKRKKKETE